MQIRRRIALLILGTFVIIDGLAWWATYLAIVLVEETSLERALGQRYLDYKQQVKGRIIPGLPI